jgi:hypothetical protein
MPGNSILSLPFYSYLVSARTLRLTRAQAPTHWIAHFVMTHQSISGHLGFLLFWPTTLLEHVTILSQLPPHVRTCDTLPLFFEEA